MNRILFLLPLLLVVSIPTAFAQVVDTQGENYDLIENFNIGEATWNSHPDRIMNGQWENYVLTNTNDKVIFNTNAVGSFIFDKDSCSYSIYENGYNGAQVIPSVSAVASYLSNGVWSNLPVNDEACTVTVSEYEDGVFLTSSKVITETVSEDVFISYTGTDELFYGNGTNSAFTLQKHINGTNIGYFNGEVTITEGAVVDKFVQELDLNINKGFKETFKVWHTGDEPLGISQTIHTGESITIGETTINIAELNGQSFDRQYIVDNEAEILQITNDVNYDMDVGIKSLTNVNIIFDGDYKVNMDYANGDDGVPFVGYLEIDPTFSSSWATQQKLMTNGSTMDTNDCNISGNHYPSWNTSSESEMAYLSHEGNGNGVCAMPVYEFDISSIPDTNTIVDVVMVYDLITVGSESGSLTGFDWINSDEQIATTSGVDLQTQYLEMKGNTQYVQMGKTLGTNILADLGTTGDSDLQNSLSQDFFTTAIRLEPFDNHPTSSWQLIFENVELQVTYGIFTAPNAPTGLSTTTGIPLGTSWTSPESSITYKIHTFTSGTSSFEVTAGSGNVEVLVVGGGGQGGRDDGAGAGAGGVVYMTDKSISTQTYSIVVAGTTGGNTHGTAGYDTTALGLTAKGGGGGANWNSNPNVNGGSGGGGASGQSLSHGTETQTSQSGDSGTYGFGSDGGAYSTTSPASGGGGAFSAGQQGGNGGGVYGYGGDGIGGTNHAGINSLLTDSNQGVVESDGRYIGGGGGGGGDERSNGVYGQGGLGGGGEGTSGTLTSASDGVANTGSGGGGAATGSGGGEGASGIVIIKYLNDGSITATGGTESSTSVSNGGNGGLSITGYKVYRSDSAVAQTELPNSSGSDSELTFTDNEFLLHGLETVTLASAIETQRDSYTWLSLGFSLTDETLDSTSRYILITPQEVGSNSPTLNVVADGTTYNIVATEDKFASGAQNTGCSNPSSGSVNDNSIEWFIVSAYSSSSVYNKCVRSYAEFDITSIPASATITDATFDINVEGNNFNNGRSIDVYSMSTQATTIDSSFSTLYSAVRTGTLINQESIDGTGSQTLNVFDGSTVTTLPDKSTNSVAVSSSPTYTQLGIEDITGSYETGIQTPNAKGSKFTTGHVLIGTWVSSIDAKLHKTGSPTGNLELNVYSTDATDGNETCQIGVMDVSTLTGSYAEYTFDTTGCEISSADYVIALDCDSCTTSDWVNIQYGGGTEANAEYVEVSGASWTGNGMNDFASFSNIIYNDLVSPSATSTTGSIGTALQNPNLSYADSNLPDNTDTLSVGGYVKLDESSGAGQVPSTWNSGTNVAFTISGDTITGTSGTWNGNQAKTNESITNGEQFDFKILGTTGASYVSIDATTTVDTGDTADFGFYIDHGTTSVSINQGGSGSASYVTGDTFSIAISSSGAVTFLKNDVSFGSSSGTASGDYYGQVVGVSTVSFQASHTGIIISAPANTKLLGLNDVTFSVGTTTADISKDVLTPVTTTEDFSSYTTQTDADTAWTTSNMVSGSSSAVNIGNDNLAFTWAVNGVQDTGTISYDLGAVQDDSWILRWDVTHSALSRALPYYWVGLTDDNTATYESGQDTIHATWGYHPYSSAHDSVMGVDDDGTGNGNQDFQLFVTMNTGTKYYLQLERVDATSYTLGMYTDNTYANLISMSSQGSSLPAEKTGAVTATTENLRYIAMNGYSHDYYGGGTSTGVIDNIVFINDEVVITPLLTATGLTDNTSTPQHYSFTRGASNDWTIYQNGVSQTTATDATSLGTNVGTNYSTKLSGSLDEFFINSDTLTSTEIAGIADRGAVLTPLTTTGASTTTYDDNTVTGGDTYYYSVRAENSVGLSDYTTFVSGLAGSPAQPPTSVSTAINTPDSTPLEVTVSWSAPTNVGTGTLTGFEIYRDGTLVSTTGLVTSYIETVPSVGTYVYSLKAIATHGTSTISATSSIDTPTAPPAPNAPTLAITNPNPSPLDIDISWTAQSNGGSSITSTEIFRTSSLSVAFTSVGTVTDLDFTDTVPNAGTWYYKTASTNLIGSSGQSGESSITTATVPASDSSVTLAISDPNASPRGITVSLVAPSSDGGSAVTGYNIYSSDDNVTFNSVATGVTADTTITVPTGGTWYFTSEPINNVGTATQGSSVSIATPTVPTASGVTLAIPSPDPSPLGIVATFTVPSSDGGSALTGYNLLSSSDDVTYDYVAQAVNGDQTITVGNAGTWYFKSQAINNVGNGTLSTAVSITTASAPVSDSSVTLTITDPNPSPLDITISLVAPSGNGGSAVTGYNIYSSDDNATFTSIASAVNGNQTVTVASAGTWYFTSEAINNAGTATQGSSVSIATPTVPTASSVTLTIDNPDPSPLTVTASFISPSSDGGSIVTGFNLYSSPDDSVYTPIAEAVNGNQTIAVASAGTWYFKSEAINNVGNGTLSSAVTVATPSVPAPSTVSLTIDNPDPSPFTVTIELVPASDGGSSITGYNLFVSPDDSTYTQIGTNIVANQTTTVANAGTWYFKSQAINNVGTGNNGTAVTVATPTVPPAPASATSVISNIDTAPYTVTVSWDLPASTGGSALTSYTVYRQTGTGTFALIDGTTALTVTDTVPTGLDQSYTYKIHALNNVGESTAFASTTITTGDVPSAPTISVTTGTTVLSWSTPSSDATVNSYKVYRALNPVSNIGTLIATVTTTGHSDFTPISFGQSYTYTVLATSIFGDSVSSNSVSTTPETEITGMIAQGVTGTGAVINWEEPAYYQGQVTSYNVYYQTPSITTGTPSTSAGTTSNTYSNFAPQLEYDTSYTFGVSINSPLGNSGLSNLVTVTTSIDGSIVAFDPTTGGMEWFDIDSVNDKKLNVIEFQRETQLINSTATDTLQVAYPSWWDSMTCNVDYKFAQKTEQYVEGTDMTAQVNSADANQQIIGFSFQDINNEVVTVECAPQQTDEDDASSGKYVMTQNNLGVLQSDGTYSVGTPSIPLVAQISNFSNGSYGTGGDFGALNIVGLFAIMISMVGFNRLSPIVGVLLSASLIFVLAWFGIVTIPVVVVGVIALVIFLAWGINRNR